MNDRILVSDKGMRAALSYDLGENPGLKFDENGYISKDKLARVSSLAWCPEMEEDDEDFDDVFVEIDDIDVLRHCPNLKCLVLNGNCIFSLEPLKEVGKKVKYAEFSSNPIKSLNGIQGMENLENLQVDYCRQLEDISALAALPKLASVDLSYTKLADFSPLLEVTSLDYVNLGGLSYDESRCHKDVFTELVARGVRIIGQHEINDWVRKWAQAAGTVAPKEDTVASILNELGLVELERIWAKDGVKATSSVGRTILMELAYIFGPSREDKEEFEQKRLELVRLLVKAGADLDADNSGTALTHTLAKREPDIALADLLLELGASPNVPKRKPALATVLGFWHKNHPEEALAYAKKLINKGANLNNEAVRKVIGKKDLKSAFLPDESNSNI